MWRHDSGGYTRTDRQRVSRAIGSHTPQSAGAAGAQPGFGERISRTVRMALPSFVQHLRLLEESGLVRSHKKGRVRTFELAPKRMRLAEDWLSRHRDIWEQRLDQLDDYLINLNKRRT